VTIEYWPVTASYNVARATSDSTSNFTVSATAGVRGLGSDSAQFEDNRAYATGNFAHLNVDLSHMQALPWDFQIALHFAAQIADQPLVPTEQFAAGGLTSVRGYLQSEAIGDDGVSESVELRSPMLIDSYIHDWRFFIFGESAEAWIIDPLAGQQKVFRLASTGFGTRFQIFDRVSANVDMAFPLIDGPTTKALKAVTSFSFKTEF
jgi:hemolysin activation/secretion protein